MLYILDNLAIGEYEEAVSPSADITALLCVAEERNLTSPRLPYCKVPVQDMKPIPAGQLTEAMDFIESMHDNGNRVLVFCSQGTCRAPSVTIAYLCCRRSFSFGQAVEAVAAKRGTMSMLPNLLASINEIRRPRTQ